MSKDELNQEPAAKGTVCTVRMTVRVKDEYDSWPRKIQFAMLAMMENIAKHGHGDLPHTQFKNEGRFEPGEHLSAVTIWALKESHFRLYGAFIVGQLILTAWDASKKQRKADREELERAATRLKPFLKRRSR